MSTLIMGCLQLRSVYCQGIELHHMCQRRFKDLTTVVAGRPILKLESLIEVYRDF